MTYEFITKYNAACYTPGRTFGKPARIVIHWWGDPSQHPTFDGVIQTFTSGARSTSAHYVVEAGRVACLVSPDDRAWACGDGIGVGSAGNDLGISIECNPRQSDEDYQTIGELVRDLRKNYGNLPLEPHSRFFNTACPGTYDLSRIDRIANGLPDSGGSKPPAPAQPSQNTMTSVHYALRVLGGTWLPEVTDVGPGDNGFAGLPNTKHDLLYVRVDDGELKYRTHVLGGGWLPWVVKGDPNDTLNGCAGNPGQPIDGVQCYYTTPGGKPLQQAWYRSQTTQRTGWLNVCCDDGSSIPGFDGWAGMMGEPLDRLQLAVANYNPF